MTAEDRSATSELEVRRVLQALRLMRTPGWQFPGQYLGLSFGAATPMDIEVGMPCASHLRDGAGRVSHLALGVLADVALAGALRDVAGAAARIVTVSARLSFADLRGDRPWVASAEKRGLVSSSVPSTAVSALTVRSGDVICCTGEASFMILDNRRGTTPHPMPRVNGLDQAEPLSVDELTEGERLVWSRASRAARMIQDGPSFLDRFWGMDLERRDGDVECRLPAGMQVGNRIGDIQGGVLMGLVARTSQAVLPPPWRLLDMAVQFISPASGAYAHARSALIRRGRQVSHVSCVVTDPEGKPLLRAQATLVNEEHAPAAAPRALLIPGSGRFMGTAPAAGPRLE